MYLLYSARNCFSYMNKTSEKLYPLLRITSYIRKPLKEALHVALNSSVISDVVGCTSSYDRWALWVSQYWPFMEVVRP